MINKILDYCDAIYQSTKFKKCYMSLIIGFSIIFIIIIPFFMKRHYFFSSLFIDILVRLFLTYTCYQGFYYISHLDEAYAQFYKGAPNIKFEKPGSIKKLINIIMGFVGGYAAFILYRFWLSLYSPFFGEYIFIIAITIGIYAAIPLLTQFNKR